MQLSRDDVAKVAKLARLEFSSEELDLFTEQLGNIVTFVEQLSEVDTTQVEEMAHPLDLHSVLRADEVTQGLTRDEALANAPARDEECFLVPAVMAR